MKRNWRSSWSGKTDKIQVGKQGKACKTRREFLVSTCRCNQCGLYSERHGMREPGRKNAIPQSARGGDGRQDVRRHKQISQMLRNIYDRQRSGALRATADGVTGNPVLRANLTISSTPYATRKFYKNELFNGTFGRMVFSYKARMGRDGRIPRQGKYDEAFYKKLDEYIVKLSICKGRFIIKPLNKLTDQLAQDMATLADLTDDDVFWDISKRSIVSAWKAGCLLWVLNNQTWTKSMGELVEWLVYHDLWSKAQLFSDLLNQDADSVSEAQRRGPKNLLDNLPNPFNEAQLEALRISQGKTKEGTKNQLYKWVHRKFITYCSQTGLYTKTQEYLTGTPEAKEKK